MTVRMTRRERLLATVRRRARSIGSRSRSGATSPATTNARPTCADATLTWQRQYDWDFIKVSPASSYCLVDWGIQTRFGGGDEGSARVPQHGRQIARDWASLPVLDPQDGALGGQLRCLASDPGCRED